MTMECRKFEITLVSADNLPDVRSFGRMKVYAEVSLNGESETKMKTTVDTVGETNPRWNFTHNYTINESSVRAQGLEVVVKLHCERTLGDKRVGEVKIPVNNLFNSGIRAVSEISYRVAGTPDGVVNILYSFGEMFLAPKPSAWKGALTVGKVVMVRGAWFLLTGDPGLFF